ncbi:prolyl oligopeptidase-like protein [Hyaloscypha variabilis]
MSKLPNNQSSSYRKQKASVAQLSLVEKLDTIPAVLSILGNVVLALFSGFYKPKDSIPKSYNRHVYLTAIRTLTRRTSVKQQHLLLPPTDDAYAAVCKKRGVKPQSEILEDGTRAHWIGDPKAEKLVMNFHGGGYCLPAGPDMIEFMFQIVDALKRSGKNAACLFLAYDLAPSAPYPRQLQQASMLLNHVLNTLHIPPSNIILTGDSAGANLALSLLSHISHPHPSPTIPIPKVSLSTPLLGCVLVSPWVSFDLSADSFKRNAWKDCIGTEAGKQWSSAFMGCPWPHTEVSDEYNQACTASAEWWEGLKVQQILVTAGEEEVLVDGIKGFVETLKKGFGEDKVEFFVAEGEYHDQPSVDLQIGIKEKDEGLQAKEIKRWISSKL